MLARKQLESQNDRGAIEAPEKEITCLFCHVFADLDSLFLPFLFFPTVFTIPLSNYKVHLFLKTQF